MQGDFQFNEQQLTESLKLIRQSLECPSCGAPTGDLTNKTHFSCRSCGESFEVSRIDERTREHLSYQKLKAMADLQVSNATMSSRMDIQYDPERFIDRGEASKAFRRFILEHASHEKLFLLLGEAGFGKTWLLAHWANQLQREGYPVFYLRLVEGIDNFFRGTFTCTRTEVFREIQQVLAEIKSEKPLIWFMDGYDEIYDSDERLLLLVEMVKFLEKNENQLLVLSSRTYEWSQCRTRQDQKARIERIMWVPHRDSAESFRLISYTPAEVEKALITYNLPPLDSWSPELRELAFYPLWVRLIAELYKQGAILPPITDFALFNAYFQRMRLTNQDLQGLGIIASLLIRTGDLHQKIDVMSHSQITSHMITVLNSSGILWYSEHLLMPTIQLSTVAFGWFGTAFQASVLARSDQSDQLQTLLTQVNSLPSRDRRFISALMASLHVQFPAAKQERRDEIPDEIIPAVPKPKTAVPKAIPAVPKAMPIKKRKTDKEILKELEHLIGKSIPSTATIEWNTLGVKFEGNTIVGLGLDNCGLTALPESIGNLFSLQKLHLKGNELTTLPESLGQLQSLQTLDIQRNLLRTLPESFGQLKSLTYLNLDSNKLMTLPESFGELQSLQNLRLEWNQLRTLPESFGGLISLKELSLWSNQLTTLPESFGQLKSLQKLYLNSNKLTTLPEPILELKNLQILYLGGTQLTTLPESFGQLKSLTWLDLTSNQLTTLPESFGGLISLQKLSLNDNQLTTLPEPILELKNLQILNLEGNQLTTLPESFGELQSLQTLRLEWNQLRTLPEPFGDLKSLKDLYLGGNQLTGLPESFGQLKSLQKLEIYENQLTALPESFTQLSNLQQLDISGNPLDAKGKKILDSLKKNAKGVKITTK